MQDHERLKAHACRLLALSQKARDDGHNELAAELTRLAADAYEHAFAMESRDSLKLQC
jgi:hypothetical protein